MVNVIQTMKIVKLFFVDIVKINEGRRRRTASTFPKEGAIVFVVSDGW